MLSTSLTPRARSPRRPGTPKRTQEHTRSLLLCHRKPVHSPSSPVPPDEPRRASPRNKPPQVILSLAKAIEELEWRNSTQRPPPRLVVSHPSSPRVQRPSSARETRKGLGFRPPLRREQQHNAEQAAQSPSSEERERLANERLVAAAEIRCGLRKPPGHRRVPQRNSFIGPPIAWNGVPKYLSSAEQKLGPASPAPSSPALRVQQQQQQWQQQQQQQQQRQQQRQQPVVMMPRSPFTLNHEYLRKAAARPPSDEDTSFVLHALDAGVARRLRGSLYKGQKDHSRELAWAELPSDARHDAVSALATANPALGGGGGDGLSDGLALLDDDADPSVVVISRTDEACGHVLYHITPPEGATFGQAPPPATAAASSGEPLAEGDALLLDEELTQSYIDRHTGKPAAVREKPTIKPRGINVLSTRGQSWLGYLSDPRFL